MGYLIAQMWLSLMIAALIGFVTAWVVHRWLARGEIQNLKIQLAEARRANEDIQGALGQARKALAASKRQVRPAEHDSPSLQPDRRSEADTLQAKIVHLEPVVKEKQGVAGEIADWEGRYHQLEARYEGAEELIAALKAELARLRQRAERGSPLRAVAEVPEVSTGTQVPADDLKRVSGIGPVFERTLNEMGIHRFEQLARLTEQDLDQIAARLETFPYRIVRDRWVEQARELAERT